MKKSYEDRDIVPERIVCAANIDRETGEVILGVRHYCPRMLKTLENKGFTPEKPLHPFMEDGFITNKNRWVDRKEAWKIAEEQDQIIRNVAVPGTLFSENLY